MAEKVYVKHGSRNKRSNEMNGPNRKALSSSIKRIKLDDSAQQSIKRMFLDPSGDVYKRESSSERKANNKDITMEFKHTSAEHTKKVNHKQERLDFSEKFKPNDEREAIKSTYSWNCSACTFLNEKPVSLACEICGTEKAKNF